MMVELEAPQVDLEELPTSFSRAAREAWLIMDPSFIKTEPINAPHEPPTILPRGKQVVHSSFIGNVCLEVGNAEPEAQACFTRHHYSPTVAPSTLAKSILRHIGHLKTKLSGHSVEEFDALKDRTIAKCIAPSISSYSGLDAR